MVLCAFSLGVCVTDHPVTPYFLVTRDNGVGAEGATKLAEALTQLKQLTSLNLDIR